MANVFKTLMRKEFGRKQYERLCRSVKEGLGNREKDTARLYGELYLILRQKDRETIEKMNRRLDESMLTAFYIQRRYGMTVLVYFAAFFVLAFYAAPVVAVPFLLFVSALFLWKTYEYMSNKFCYIDVHIALIYKSVLQQFLPGGRREE